VSDERSGLFRVGKLTTHPFVANPQDAKKSTFFQRKMYFSVIGTNAQYKRWIND